MGRVVGRSHRVGYRFDWNWVILKGRDQVVAKDVVGLVLRGYAQEALGGCSYTVVKVC